MTKKNKIAVATGGSNRISIDQVSAEKSFARIMAPIMISVFAIYLTIGMVLGILPGFIKNELNLSSVIVGVVIGLQSLATLLTRAYSGKVTDTEGAKKSNHKGISLILLSGLLYMTAAFFSRNVPVALGFIILARIVHGGSESLSITGALTWGIGLAGAQHSGKVMTWNGIAMYAGIAIGAPIGIWMKGAVGMEYVFASIIVLAIISWAVTVRLPALTVDASKIRKPFYKVIGLIAGQGLGLAFSSIGFACISSFVFLLFSAKSWHDPSMAFMSFGISYVLTRVFFSSFPDRFGGYRVALVSLTIEVAGQLLIGFASSQTMAIAGCSVTGIGFSLIFPALGVLAIKKVDAGMRGTALGAYAAFFDLSLGLAGPIAGVIAGWYSYQAIYLFGAVSCLVAMVVLLFNRRP